MRRVSGTTDARAQLISVDGWRLIEDRIEPDPWSWVYFRPDITKKLYRLGLVVALLLLAAPAAAQPPVVRWADWTSYGTAAVNPAIALVTALRSPSRGCHLWRLGLSELVGNGASLGLKALIRSPRPCLGCASDGMPSGHSMNGVIGATARGWGWGLAFAVPTPALRIAAHRHTRSQAVWGTLLGATAEAAGQLVRCGP